MKPSGIVAVALVVLTTAACDDAARSMPADAGAMLADAGAGAGCPAGAVDAHAGACFGALSPAFDDCRPTWAEQRLVGCRPGVVVFVSAEDPAARQWLWFERPWFSGGLSCFYDPASGALAGMWVVKDYPVYCCGTSFDVAYGDVDQSVQKAAAGAANPWVGHFYDVDGTEQVEGGAVKYCASPDAG